MTGVVICPRCQAHNLSDSRYCDQCSLPLHPVSRAGAAGGPTDGAAIASTAVSAGASPARPTAPAPPPAGPPGGAGVAAKRAFSPASRWGRTALGLLIGFALILFVAAVVQAAVLLSNAPASGVDPAAADAAAALIAQQATALAGQQTITAQYNAQATRLAEQPSHIQATITALSQVRGANTPDAVLRAAFATATAEEAAIATLQPGPPPPNQVVGPTTTR